jgi:hypothetical protein
VILEPQDQALALGNFAWFGSLSLEPLELGDVRAQMSDQPIESPLVGHEPAS